MTVWTRGSDRTSAMGGLAGLVGIGIPLLGLMIFPIWRFPTTTASGDVITAFARTHGAALQAMMITYTLGVTLWLVFGASVWAHMRAALPADSMLTTCFAAGIVALVTLLLAGFACFDVLVYRHPGAGEAKLLYDLTFGLLAMSGMPTAIALSAFAAAAYVHGVFARAAGHLAVVTAAAHVCLLLSFIVGRGFLSLEGAVIAVIPAPLWIWIAYTSGTLISARRGASRQAVARQGQRLGSSPGRTGSSRTGR